MHIALDCSEAASTLPQGVAVYVHHLVRGLAQVAAPEDRIELVYQARRWAERGLGPKAPDARFRTRRLPAFSLLSPWTRGTVVFHALSPRLPKARFRRRVVTFHDLYPIVLDKLWTGRGEAAERRHRRRRERYLIVAREADAVICVSQNTRRDLLAVVPDVEAKTAVIPLGVEQDLAARVPPEGGVRDEVRRAAEQPYLFHVGSFLPVRNLPQTVRAFARVAAELPDVRLVLAGGGTSYAEREKVKSEIAANGLGTRALLLGVVSEPEKLFLLSRAKGLVMFHLYAGFGLPALEAMSMGIPAALSPRGSLPEVAGDAVLYADAEDDAAMAGAMLSLLTDDEGNRSRIATGRARAARYRWDAATQATYNLYRELTAALTDGCTGKARRPRGTSSR